METGVRDGLLNVIGLLAIGCKRVRGPRARIRMGYPSVRDGRVAANLA